MVTDEAIKKELALFVEKDALDLDDNANLRDIVVDSFLLVELVAHLQFKFQFSVNREELGAIETVRQLIDFVQSKETD